MNSGEGWFVEQINPPFSLMRRRGKKGSQSIGCAHSTSCSILGLSGCMKEQYPTIWHKKVKIFPLWETCNKVLEFEVLEIWMVSYSQKVGAESIKALQLNPMQSQHRSLSSRSEVNTAESPDTDLSLYIPESSASCYSQVIEGLKARYSPNRTFSL